MEIVNEECIAVYFKYYDLSVKFIVGKMNGFHPILFCIDMRVSYISIDNQGILLNLHIVMIEQ